jgi:hypothetical protein
VVAIAVPALGWRRGAPIPGRLRGGLRMSEREKPFSVSDRRHFTPEGQPREEGAAPVEGSVQPSPPPAAAGAAGGESPPRSTAAAEEGMRAPHGSRPAGPVDFAQFLLSLGAQAEMLLSGAGQDQPVERASAIEGVRSVISILEMLREKTEGRRTPDEDRILEGLLFELRMAFVERRRAGEP